MSVGWVRPRRRREASVDPGLQSERTAMAWQRTALGIGGVSALLLHPAGEAPVTAVPGVLGLLVALVLLVAAERRYERTVRRVAVGETPVRPFVIRTVAATTTMLAVAALVLIAVGLG